LADMTKVCIVLLQGKWDIPAMTLLPFGAPYTIN
jgi:hypothetical protein